MGMGEPRGIYWGKMMMYIRRRINQKKMGGLGGGVDFTGVGMGGENMIHCPPHIPLEWCGGKCGGKDLVL